MLDGIAITLGLLFLAFSIYGLWRCRSQIRDFINEATMEERFRQCIRLCSGCFCCRNEQHEAFLTDEVESQAEEDQQQQRDPQHLVTVHSEQNLEDYADIPF